MDKQQHHSDQPANQQAAKQAKPASRPVLPEVGSMMVEPGLMRPVRSASETMRYAMRSFTDPPALKNSHLASAVYEMIHVSGSVGQQGVQGGSQRSCSTQAGADPRARTELAFQAFLLCDPVDAHKGRVACTHALSKRALSARGPCQIKDKAGKAGEAGDTNRCCGGRWAGPWV